MSNEIERETGLQIFNTLYDESNLENEKAAAFDQIAKLFYDGNFGSASKSEIELLMFSIYMDAMIQKNKNKETGVLNYKECSDYKIGKALGIPQEKVRNLKVKKQARYPEKFDWKMSLIELKENIRYDEAKQKIIIPAPDPNLYNEIQNFIEEKGGYLDVSYVKKCIQIRPEYYLMLFYESLEDEKDKRDCLKRAEKELQKINKLTSFSSLESKEEMWNHIFGITENSIGLVSNIIGVFNSPLSAILKGVSYVAKK